MRLQGMDLNSYVLDAINREAIKVEQTPTIKTVFLVMALRQKLPRPSYKSNVNNISHCQACTFIPQQTLFVLIYICSTR